MRAWLNIFMITLMLASFQNCSNSKLITEYAYQSNDSDFLEFFDYRYTQKPNVYENTALIFPDSPTQNPSFSQFSVIINLVPTDGSKNRITYSAVVRDQNNNPIPTCNTDGTLDPAYGEDRIDFQCLAPTSVTQTKIDLSVSYNGSSESFISTFTRQ